MSSGLPKKRNEDSTSDVLARTFQALIEEITGLGASTRQDWSLSIGHILQRIRGGKFLGAVRHEWDAYREKGRIPDDYVESEQHQECLQELLDFLDDESPDSVRFDALKKILMVAATEERSSRNDVLPQQFMRIVRSLSAGESIVLLAAFNTPDTYPDAARWLDGIARKSGLKHPDLVEFHEERLIEKHLLLPRARGDKSAIVLGGFGRLTTLAYDLCTFINAYRPE